MGRIRTATLRQRITLIACAALAALVIVASIAVALEITLPPDPRHTATTAFTVRPGESPDAVTAQLARDGLIRNIWLFQRIAHLPNPVAPGIYRLAPSMSMATVAGKLGSGQPDAVTITIPPGLRVTQYPALLTPTLPHVQAQAFLRIATTGTLPDGTALTSRFWYLEPKQPRAAFALEGYLLPGTYVVDTSSDATAVIEQLLGALGDQLCPGPDAAHLDAYRADATACQAHAATVASGAAPTSLFTAMERQFATSDPRQALYDTLTLAAIVARESATPADVSTVAAVYANRYTAARTNTPDPAGDIVNYLDAPSTAQYARDTDHPPASGGWWAPLSAPAATTDPTNPYNTGIAGNAGLPPGPIAAPSWSTTTAVATANTGTPSPDYFLAAICGQMAYATSAAEDQGIQVKAQYEASHQCQSPLLALPPAPAHTLPTAPAQMPPAPAPPPANSAAAAVLLDPATGQVYFAQNADDERAMASTTKMMTALVALTYGNLDQPITVGQDVAQLDGTGASLAYLHPGDVLTLRDLLYGLLLPSGDDAAIVIADGIAGSQAGFIYLMNDEARLLGLTHTHFVNVHGLDAPGHYSSALDLARLASFVLRNPTFAAVVGSATDALPGTTSHQPYTWQNTNKLLFPPVYPGILGVKTGATGNAGYCLVFAAAGPTGRLVGVVLDEPTEESRFADARALLNWGFTAQAHTNWLLRQANLLAA